MIRTYLLGVVTLNNTEQVLGSEYIHDALLEATDDPLVRKLIMDTTPEEHAYLVNWALSWSEATQEEIGLFNTMVIIYPPSADYIRTCELLESSPDVITQPEIWELMRLIGRRLGYRFED